MNLKVKNIKIAVGNVQIGGMSNSSIVLVGDTDVITSSHIFDTPTSSVIFTSVVEDKEENV